jgi:tryptophanyl-tRNA synthetase
LLVEALRPIKVRLDQLTADPAELDRLLATGAERARALAAPTLASAYKAMGL